MTMPTFSPFRAWMLVEQLLTFIYIAPLSVSAAPLWPVPTTQSLGTGVLWLPDELPFTVAAKNATQVYSRKNATEAITTSSFLDAAIQRTSYYLYNDAFVPWKFHPRNQVFEPDFNGSKTTITGVTLRVHASDTAAFYKSKAGEVDESYTLTIPQNGQITITGMSCIGLLRGLSTLEQLFYAHSSGGIYTPYSPVSISDRPKFAHRGLNMDVARNYFPPSNICRTIDALSWNKYNRLHLHITDAQSWPLEIPALPDLAGKGAYAPGLHYTPDDLKMVQEYGAYRGVEVIIETDMPGHTASIWFGYPDLITAFNVQPAWATYSAEPPTGQLKLNNTAVTTFLTALWNDLLPRVSPYTSYFHTGGDEVKANPYLLDAGVKSNDSKVLQPLLQSFLDFNHDALRKAGLTPVVWEEQLLQWNLTLGSDVVVQTWGDGGPDAVARTVQKGHKALAGDYNYWYLDCGHGAWLDSPPGAPSTAAFPYLDYCSPLKNWRTVYSYDPLAGVPANLSSLVLGGEVHMWAEQIDPSNFDSIAWPRASAAGEVLWSGAKDASGQNRSQIEASPRLAEWRERMVRRGIMAGVVQMPFCTQNGSMCVGPGT